MKTALRNLLFAAFLLSPGAAWSQGCSFPQGLAPNVVVGRLGVGPGPCQAIPFATLSSKLTGAIITLNSGNGQTAPGGMSGGNTYSFGATTDTPQFAGAGFGGAAPATGLQLYNAAVTPGGNGQGVVGETTINGGIFGGQGSTYDAALVNKSLAVALAVPTGTQSVVLQGALTAASLTTSGTIAGSLCATSAGVILYEATINCFAVSGISVVSGKTLTIDNTLELAGTDGTKFTFPSNSPDTVDTLGANQTVSGNKTFSGTLNITGTGQINGTAFGTFATQNFATPPAIGGTTPASGAFSTLTATTPIGLTSGGSNNSTVPGARGPTGYNIDELTSHGDSNYAILSTDRTVGTSTTLTSPRTWTLPAASSVNSGQHLYIQDFKGFVSGTNTITIPRNGSDTINGGTGSQVINTANGGFLFISDGVSNWSAQALGAQATSGVASINGQTGSPSIVAGTGTNVSTTGGNIQVAIAPIISNSLTSFTMQDLSSSADKLTEGVSSSSACDPGYAGTPGSGPCAAAVYTPNAVVTWNTMLLEAVNSRAVFSSASTAANSAIPELICVDANGAAGIPQWLANFIAGCGYTELARTGTGAPSFFQLANNGAIHSVLTASSATSSGGRSTITVTAESGSPIVLGETIIGGSIPSSTTIVGNAATNPGFCSPNCTGAGGIGTYSISTVTGTIVSELMIGGPSGAEGSHLFEIFGGSLDGLTQNQILFFNAVGCASASEGSCSNTLAGMRLGEISGLGMSADGLFTQTESWSINGYAAANFAGTHLDGSYTAPSNIVFRQAPNSSAVERTTDVFDYNANLLVGTGWSATSAKTATVGAIYLTTSGGTTVPANPGDMNIVYGRSSQQGISIQPNADTGGGNAILFQNTAGSGVGSISTTSSATTYATSSDRRLKEHIMPTKETDVGALIDRLQVVNYNFKNDPAQTFTGFIAQDEYKVAPFAVARGDDTNAEPGDSGFRAWGRDDSKLVPLLVREIQDLRKRLASLEQHRHRVH